ncbi:MAG: GWxTD domain-containing protein [Anaerolineae bacterium]|nr:GWxTD domain-containing protein [Gemmatimonadaceae bacterium]
MTGIRFLMTISVPAFTALGSGASAQDKQIVTADSLVAHALDRARSGDTASAIKALERATKVAPRYAQPYYHRGVLLSRSSVLGLSDMLRRRAASGAIKDALDLDPGNPAYLMELGRIRLKTPFLRLDAERLFKRALTAAEKRGDPRVLAEIRWELGQIHERRYMTMANRRMPVGSLASFDPQSAVADWRYTKDFFDQGSMVIEEAGELNFRKAEDLYRSALHSDSSHLGAALGLLGLLYEGGRYEEVVATGDALRRGLPNEPRLLMALGLALHRLDRDNDAARMFQPALALLLPDERREMLGLETILRREEAKEYLRLGDSSRTAFEELYWNIADPVRLTAANEARIEFLSRVTYADLRFTSQEFRQRGWRTDRGEIVIRYGQPPLIATIAPETQDINNSESMARVTTIWYYPDSRQRFVFVGPPAMNYARYAGNFQAYADDARYRDPVSFANLKSRLPVDSIGVQVARFRGDGPGNASVSFFADVPVAKLLANTDVAQATLETGFFLSLPDRRPVATAIDSAVVRLERPDAVSERSWHHTMSPGQYLYRIEARQGVSGRNARSMAPVRIEDFRSDALLLSDILVARQIGFRDGGTKLRSRDDLLIRPSGTFAFMRNDTIHIYWETYGLARDSAGVGHSRVKLNLHVDRLERSSKIDIVLGGLGDAFGLTAKGDDRASLTYNRTIAPDVMDRAPDYLALAIGDSPAGTYTLEIEVSDLASGRVTRRQRVLFVRSR